MDYPKGTIQMEQELCLVDSATTNTILREIKYFQTLTKSKGLLLRVKEKSQLSQVKML